MIFRKWKVFLFNILFLVKNTNEAVMKKIILILSILSLSMILAFASGSIDEKEEYLRIHIRANSNSSEDQKVKYLVKDEVVDALIPVLAEIETFEEAKNVTEKNFELITKTADKVLEQNGFEYKSSVRLCQEKFPTRKYGDLTLESGVYDAIIIDLGSGEGDNWWCLVYPAFCFTYSKKSTNFEYISKILEILNIVKHD